MSLSATLKQGKTGRPREEGDLNPEVLMQTDLPEFGIAVLKTLKVPHHDAEDIAYDAWYTTAMAWKPGGKSIKNYYYGRLLGRLSNRKDSWARESKNLADYAYFTQQRSYKGPKEIQLEHDIAWLLGEVKEKYGKVMYDIYVKGWNPTEYSRKSGISFHALWHWIRFIKPILRDLWSEENARAYRIYHKEEK